MRKITQQSVNAFNNSVNFKSANTRVIAVPSGSAFLELHGNTIAQRLNIEGIEDVIVINACGWLTTTTKERLNALPNVSIKQKAGVWYLNGKQWDGSAVAVSPRHLPYYTTK